MDQTHISYTYWQQPPIDKLPELKHIDVPEKADMALNLEGTDRVLPDDQGIATLTFFPTENKHYLEVFNRGGQAFAFTATASEPWVKLSPANGIIDKEQRFSLTTDTIDMLKNLKITGSEENKQFDNYQFFMIENQKTAAAQKKKLTR